MPTNREHPHEALSSFITKSGGSAETRTLPRISMGPSAALTPPSMKDNVKVTNRAEVGAMKGRPIVLVANSQEYPIEAEMDDESTWLQPGESMEVPKGVVIINFGYVFSQQTPMEKTQTIRQFGDFQYARANRDIGAKPMIIIGPPLRLPDLVLVQLDSRKKETGPTVELYPYLISNQQYVEDPNPKRK